METDNAAARYHRRMRFIQRWRRTAVLICVFLVLDIVVTALRDPGFSNPRTIAVEQSLFVFIVAVLIAINFLTFRLRK